MVRAHSLWNLKGDACRIDLTRVIIVAGDDDCDCDEDDDCDCDDCAAFSIVAIRMPAVAPRYIGTEEGCTFGGRADWTRFINSCN